MNTTARAKVPEDEAAQNARDNIWPTIAAGCGGCLMWVPEYRDEVREFALASRILREFNLAGFKRDKPDIQVFQSTLQENDLSDAMRWVGYCMRTGYDMDFVIAPERPASVKGVLHSVDEIPGPRALADAWRPFEVSSGYFIQVLIGNARTKGLMYLANIAGGIKQGTDKQWLRDKAETALWLMSRLDPENYILTVYDLDTGSRTTTNIRGNQLLNLGRSSHDYVVTFTRSGR